MKRSLLIVLTLFASANGSLASQQHASLVRSVTREKKPIASLATTPAMRIEKDGDLVAAVRGGADTKLGKFVTRATSAVVALSGLYLLIKNTGEKGMIGLIIASQIGMFSEASNVAGVSSSTKWLTLLTHMIFWNARHLLKDQGAKINIASFGLLVDTIMLLVLQQNRNPDGAALRNFVVSNLSAAIVVGMSSSWLATLKDYSMAWIFYPGLLVIINDTMAYICGQLMGKNALLPNISPNKTWEGFIGAMVFTVALSKPLWRWLGSGNDMNQNQLYLLAAYVSLVAPFGGFLASTVKRTFDHKDFGAVMPGHGGLVDRLDCQLLTAPFVYLFLQFLGGATTATPIPVSSPTV